MPSPGNGNLADHNNLADHLIAALAPCQYEGLLSRRTVADIRSSDGGSFPAAMTSLWGFECLLGQQEPVADFLVRIGAEPEAWPLLERDAAGRNGEIWRRIESLLAERAKSGSALSAMLQNLWLEYDLIHPMNTASDPSVFFGTDKLTKNAETAWAVDLAAKLRGEPLSGASRHTVNELVAALPEAAKLFQVGVMCSRPRSPLRVCVIGQEFADIPAFLAAVHWPGEWPRVSETLERFTPLIDHVALDFDILDDGLLAPKIGIELYQKSTPDLGARTVELVNLLCIDNLCVPQKAMGLLAWGGITHERLYPDLWPATLITRRALRGGSESSTFCRWLHHVKVALEPNTPPIAKAYLAVSHAFLADSAIREALQQAANTDGQRGQKSDATAASASS